MIFLAFSRFDPPEPAQMIGKAIDRNSVSLANDIAFRTESRIDRSEARQSMLIPGTWMIALINSFPAEVRTAVPSGMAPCLESSLNSVVPPRFLIASDTPCGRRSHQGMMFRFHAFTTTSASWSRRSPSTTVSFMANGSIKRTGSRHPRLGSTCFRPFWPALS